MSRKELALEFLRCHHALLRCPTCALPVEADAMGIVCQAGHRVDVSRRGTVALTAKRGDARYDSTLFAARRALHGLGFWKPLEEALTPYLRPAFVLADLGCGEGSLLRALQGRLGIPVAFGVDISPAAVEMASSYTGPGTLFLRGDVARLPLADAGMDCLLNILTPAHYDEFRRVLKPGGRLIKVIPTEKHLEQMRLGLQKTDPKSASARQLFESMCENTQTREVTYTMPVGAQAAAHVAAMSPLCAGREAPDLREITFSFWVCAGTW